MAKKSESNAARPQFWLDEKPKAAPEADEMAPVEAFIDKFVRAIKSMAQREKK